MSQNLHVKSVKDTKIYDGYITMKTRAVTKNLMRLNTPTSALTETSILYTDRHMDTLTDKLIPLYP